MGIIRDFGFDDFGFDDFGFDDSTILDDPDLPQPHKMDESTEEEAVAALALEETVAAPSWLKTYAFHPTYKEMSLRAVTALKGSSGINPTVPAIKKYIMTHFNVGHDVAFVGDSLRRALKKACEEGDLKKEEAYIVPTK